MFELICYENIQTRLSAIQKDRSLLEGKRIRGILSQNSPNLDSFF